MRQQMCFIMILMMLGKLSACSSKKPDSTKPGTTTAKILESVDSFQRRTIYKTLTDKIIDSIPDDNLLQVVFDNLSEKLPTDADKEYSVVSQFNKSRQAVFIVWLLEAEVNNGGFNQFYANSSGQYAAFVPEALKLIKAKNIASLMERANTIFNKEQEKIRKYQDGSTEGFSKSYEDNPLNALDDEFYRLDEKKENLEALMTKFIREHKIDFVDK